MTLSLSSPMGHFFHGKFGAVFTEHWALFSRDFILGIGIVQHALHALICAEDWRAGWQRAGSRLKEKPAGINLPAANEMVIIKALLQ